MLEEIKKLKEKVEELERKVYLVNDYELISAILKKLNVEVVEITKEEYEANKPYYIVQRTEDKFVVMEESYEKESI